ncbi:MAG: hypothetical protein R3E95_23450 [Thiolinea sp.]
MPQRLFQFRQFGIPAVVTGFVDQAFGFEDVAFKGEDTGFVGVGDFGWEGALCAVWGGFGVLGGVGFDGEDQAGHF